MMNKVSIAHRCIGKSSNLRLNSSGKPYQAIDFSGAEQSIKSVSGQGFGAGNDVAYLAWRNGRRGVTMRSSALALKLRNKHEHSSAVGTLQ